MKKNSRKRLAAMFTVVAILMCGIVTAALFTDREQAQTEYTAGTLDIVLAETWEEDNETAVKNYTPGDKLALNYSLENKGNLDAKVRETFVITTSKPVTNEFEIYLSTDVVEDETTGLWVANTNAAPIEVRTAESYGNGTKITYEIPEIVLAAGDTESFSLVLLFHKDAKNVIKGTEVKVEYVAQALQDRNTGDDTWKDAKVISETITIGGTDKYVVPNLN